MKQIERGGFAFLNLHHVGVLVSDMDQAIEYYQSLGIGPFESPTYMAITERRVYGQPAPGVKCRHSLAKLGPIQLELVQPVSGESIQKEFLDNRGEGVNHLAFSVYDLDQEVANLADRGFDVISSGRFVDGGGFAYLDTAKVGGISFELIQLPDDAS